MAATRALKKASDGKSAAKPPDERINVGQRTVKRSVTFTIDVDQRAHQVVGDREFSAFVNEATRAALNLLATKRLVDEFEAEHGVITPQELATARRKLGLKRP